MGYRLGVDLGTTFTAAAIGNGQPPAMLGLGNRALQIPSVLFLQDDGQFLIGEAAERRGYVEPARVVREFKRRMGDPVPILVAGTPFSPQALTARLLSWVVASATERQGGAPTEVVLTYPANWGDYKRELLDQVITMADIGQARTCTEPQAAAIQYAARANLQPGARVAVYDLGGGTFDVCVLEKTPEGFAILGSPEGVEHLGGVDFDEAVFQHVVNALGPALQDLDLDDTAVKAALTRLRRDCVEAKEALSADVDTVIPVSLPGRNTTVRLTRAELENLIGPALQDTVAATTRALRAAGITAADLTAIVLVGGSSRIPLVSHLLQSEFGTTTALDTHPKHDIALGAVQFGSPGTAAVAAPPVRRRPGQSANGSAQPATAQGGPAGDAAGSAGTGGSAAGPSGPTAEPAGSPMVAGAAGLAAGESAKEAREARARQDAELIRDLLGPSSAQAAAVTQPMPVTPSGPPAGAAGSPPGTTGGSPPGAGPAGRQSGGHGAGQGGGPPPGLAVGAASAGQPPGLASPVAGPGPGGGSGVPTSGVPSGPGGFGGQGDGEGRRRMLLAISGASAAVVVVVVAIVAALAMRGDGQTPAGTVQPSASQSAPASSAPSSVAPPRPGAPGIYDMALSGDGSRMYVTNRELDTLSVVDLATKQLIGRPIPIGEEPLGVGIAPAGEDVYAANGSADTIRAVNTTTLKQIGNPIKVGKAPLAVIMDPTAPRAWVTNRGSNSVSVVDTTANQTIATVPVGTNPLQVLLSPDRGRAYVSNFGSSSLSVIDMRTNRPVGDPIQVPAKPHSLALRPGSTTLFVTHIDSREVTVIDTATNRVSGPPIVLPMHAWDVVASRDGRWLYATLTDDNKVAVVDAATHRVLPTRITVGKRPTDMAVSADGSQLYVANNGSGTISVIDTAANKLVDTISVPK